MKLLMLGWELPPYNSGGLGVASYNMAKALAHRGVDIQFILPYAAKHTEAERFMKIIPAANVPPLINEAGEYVAMGAYSGTCSVCHSRDCEHAREYGNDFVAATRRYADQVVKLILRRKLRPDVIHAHDWLTMEAGVRAKLISGRPLVVHVHATEFDRAGGHSGNPLIHEIEYQGLVMADRILAVSQLTKDIIVKEYHIPPDKIEVVHNSFEPSDLEDIVVDVNDYLYAKELKRHGYTIVSPGGVRLTAQKGISYLLEAMALAMSKNPKLLLLVPSSGDQRDQIIELSADLGISDRVIFLGFVRGSRQRELYDITDIFVMPSVSEPFGITALEAAHSDTALLLSKQSGVGELLRNVMRFDYWDTRRLADEIVNISLSPGLSTELREGAQREYLRFSWSDVAEKLSHEYQKVIARSRQSSVDWGRIMREGAYYA
ncbi:glycosyltransferase family 4 protein [Candidatus Saccharibacteria bacterium]|nr:glycosyltransferase family 4 protein [Candidatus Saccharibacteria bacterium]